MEKEMAFLNSLKILESEIYDCYTTLAQIEKTNNKQDSKYTHTLTVLNELYEKEKKLISKIPQDLTSIGHLILILYVDNYEIVDIIDNSQKDENYKTIVYKLDYSNEKKYCSTEEEQKEELIKNRILDHLSLCEDKLKIQQIIKDTYDEDDVSMDLEDIYTLLEPKFIKRQIIEFYNRFQKRIDNSSEDKEELITEKYNMLFQTSLIDADALCTEFKFDNILSSSNLNITNNLRVSQEVYETNYLMYLQQSVVDTINQLIWLEKNEDDLDRKKIDFKIRDLFLENDLSYFSFVNLCELKENILENLINSGMEKSLTYHLVKENFDEAISYACTYSRKLETKPKIKLLKKGELYSQLYN